MQNRFPASGLLAQYKSFILSEAKRYTQLYFPIRPLAQDLFDDMFEDVLAEAVRLAVVAEQKFDASRGYDFSTLLRWHLKGLHRFCQKEWRNRYSALPMSPMFEGQKAMYRRANGARAATMPQPDRRYTERPRRRLKRINWREHRPALIKLEQNQRESLRPTEKAVLDWMIQPGARNLKQVAEGIGVSKGQASKIRYRLLAQCIAR
jgi:hypothetical protein